MQQVYMGPGSGGGPMPSGGDPLPAVDLGLAVDPGPAGTQARQGPGPGGALGPAGPRAPRPGPSGAGRIVFSMHKLFLFYLMECVPSISEASRPT